MWFWEIIYKNKEGCKCSLYSLEGYKSASDCFEIYASLVPVIKQRLVELGCALIIDEQIIYKTSGQLYTDGGCL